MGTITRDRQPTSQRRRARRTASQTIRTAPRRTHPPVSPIVVKRTRRKILLGLYALLLVELIVAFCTTPLLTIKRVTVSGLSGLPPAEAAETLRDSALPRNIHWLRAPTRTMQTRLQQLPWIQSAIVQRHLFSNALTVAVTPRQPDVLIKANGQTWEADTAGNVLRLARPGLLNRLPRIILDSRPAIKSGVSLASPPLAAAISIHHKLQADSKIPLAKIVIDGSGNLCLNMRDGLPFHFGQPEDVDAKIKLTRAIYIKDPQIANTLASVNLTSPAAPACTPKQTQAAIPDWLAAMTFGSQP